jgi:hypothetical protein
MRFYNLDKYLNRLYEFAFPPQDLSPEEKNEKDWNLQMCEAIWALQVNNKCGIKYSELNKIRTNRLYSQASQDSSQYQEKIFEWQQDDLEKKGYVNLNFKNISVMPKMLQIYLAIAENINYKIRANAIDPYSMTQKEYQKYKIWYQKEFAKENREIDQQLGIESQQVDFNPDSLDEIDVYMDLGGFKLIPELAIEESLIHTYDISNWKEISRKIHTGLWENNGAFCHAYYDPIDKKVKIKYIPLDELIIQYSKSNDFENSHFGGHLEPYTPVELRREAPWLKEEDIKDICKNQQGYYGNPNFNEGNWYNDMWDTNTKKYLYDNFIIWVLNCSYISINTEYDQKKKNSYGNEMYVPQKSGGKISRRKYNTEKRKTVISEIGMLYNSKWIIGTDKLIRYGKADYVPRKNERVHIPYYGYLIPGPSKVETSQVFIDNAQLAYLKIQNLSIMATPNIIAIEESALDNLDFGAGPVPKLELFKITTQTGRLIYKATTARGNLTNPAAMHPITELRGGIGPALQEQILILDKNLEMIREVTGLNRIADASTPDPEQSVKGSQIALLGANNALKMLLYAFLDIYKKSARSICMTIKDLITLNEKSREAYISVIGKIKTDVMKLIAGLSESDLSILVEPLPDDEQKMKLEQRILAAMRPGKEGVTPLTMRDSMILDRLINSGNYKYAELYLAKREFENEQFAMQKIMENQNMNAQQNIAMEEKKKNDEKERITHETNEKIREYKEMKEIDKGFEETKHNFKLEEIEKQNEFKKSEKTQPV